MAKRRAIIWLCCIDQCAGSRIAIGALYNDGNGSDAGHVRIYDYSPDTDSWSQVQSDIDGEAAEDRSGYGVICIW